MNTTVRMFLTGLIAACTATTGRGAGAEPKPKAKAKSIPAQSKLGHFTTADGQHGFVFDRSGAIAKLKLDDDKAIIELTREEDRDDGELIGYRYLAPDGKLRVYVSTFGAVQLVRGNDRLFASVDEDEVKPLGAPTIKGQYVKPRPAWEKIAADLRPLTVRAKLPTLTSLDASNLSKVKEAYDAATVDMFVRYRDPGKNGDRAYLSIAPSNVKGRTYGTNEFVTDETETKRHGRLAKHGALIHGYSSPEPRGNHIIVRRADVTSGRLADNTPGLLWEIEGHRAVFVSFDGARYSVSLSQRVEKPVIERGAGRESAWPKPAIDTYVDMEMISQLENAKAVPATTVDALDKIDGEWNACVVKGWTALTAKHDAKPLSVGQQKDGIRKLHLTCNKYLDEFEAIIVKFADERAKIRTALFGTASARAKKVGAAN